MANQLRSSSEMPTARTVLHVPNPYLVSSRREQPPTIQSSSTSGFAGPSNAFTAGDGLSLLMGQFREAKIEREADRKILLDTRECAKQQRKHNIISDQKHQASSNIHHSTTQVISSMSHSLAEVRKVNNLPNKGLFKTTENYLATSNKEFEVLFRGEKGSDSDE